MSWDNWRAHLHPSARPVVGTSASQSIAMESGQPGATVSGVARKHGIVTGLLFRWRVQFGVAQKNRANLVPVALADDMAAARVLRDLVHSPEGMIVVELPDGRRVFATTGSYPDAVQASVESGGDRAMLIVPADVNVHLALGYTDMRKGGLTALFLEKLDQHRRICVSVLTTMLTSSVSVQNAW